MKSVRALGMMTGTSCDGLDAACVEIDANGWQPLWADSVAYPKKLRERVLAVQKPGAKLALADWMRLNRDLGEWYAEGAARLIRAHDEKPDLIANHGQTIGHFPDEGFTVQLGDPARIARETGLTVIARFRDGDMAAGGQGAPLVPLFHQILAHMLAGDAEGIAIHNIGGISNLTYLGPNGSVLAFDTGPGNIWIDAAAEQATRGKQKFDRDGALARKSEPDWAAVKKILKHPYFAKKPPKSTGRDDFPIQKLTSATRTRGADLVGTATAVTVESIANAYQKWIIGKGLPLRAIYFCGGGAKNPAILAGVSQLLPGVQLLDLQDEGVDPQFVEAQAFAFFGFLSLMGTSIGGPWTGVNGFAPPGQIVPGENWPDLLASATELFSAR